MGSNVHPNARGTFVGLSTNHTRKHMLRSVYEGIAFCHRAHFDRLMATREAPPRCIRLAGGAARSAVWTQMFADIMNQPIVTVDANETGALGCAISVAAATGAYPTLAEAAAHMSRFAPPVYPNPEKVAIYEKKYQLYQKAVACLDTLWPEMQQVVEGK